MPIHFYRHRLYVGIVVRAKAAQLIRAARKDVGMTQASLAVAAGIHQPTVAAYESGRRIPNNDTLRALLTAARTRPSVVLAVLADEIIAAAAQHNIFDVRVFGSVLDGRDTQASDIDLLVSPGNDVSVFGLGSFVAEVQALTGFPVDVMTQAQTRWPELSHIARESVPL